LPTGKQCSDRASFGRGQKSFLIGAIDDCRVERRNDSSPRHCLFVGGDACELLKAFRADCQEVAHKYY
jgi:hypothetical protein